MVYACSVLLRLALPGLAIAGVACGSDPTNPDLTLSTTLTVTEATGNGTSPLEAIVNQPTTFTIDVVAPGIGHDTENTCRWTTLSVAMPTAIASGTNAALVQTEVLDRLPGYDVRLELCDPADLSSASLFADNQAGLGVTIGCKAVPSSAMVKDGHGDPLWTAFTASSCDASIYDQLRGRLYTAHDFSVTFARYMH